VKRRFFNLYQYLSPLILTPLSFWLWWQTYQQNLQLTLVAWLIPILYSYIVPAVGTNVLKVWEFDTRFRLGRFRPHHGFVFGSATSMIAWLCYPGSVENSTELFLLALLFALALGVINLVYDIKALNAGVLHVYNQPWADGKTNKAIAMDYAPWFFGGFGAAYGISLGMAELLNTQALLSGNLFAAFFLAALVLCIAVPVMGYRLQSFKKHGHSGCRPIEKKAMTSVNVNLVRPIINPHKNSIPEKTGRDR